MPRVDRPDYLYIRRKNLHIFGNKQEYICRKNEKNSTTTNITKQSLFLMLSVLHYYNKWNIYRMHNLFIVIIVFGSMIFDPITFAIINRTKTQDIVFFGQYVGFEI